MYFEEKLFLQKWKKSINKSRSIEDTTATWDDNPTERKNVLCIHFYKNNKYYYRIFQWCIENNIDVDEFEGMDEVGDRYQSLKLKFKI